MFEYTIDGTLLRGASRGRVTDATCHQVRYDIAHDPRYTACSNELWNLSEYESFEVTVDGIRSLLSLFEDYREIFAGRRCAYVAPSDLAYGMARICESLSKHNDFEMRAFRSVDEAEAWIGIAHSRPRQKRGVRDAADET